MARIVALSVLLLYLVVVVAGVSSSAVGNSRVVPEPTASFGIRLRTAAAKWSSWFLGLLPTMSFFRATATAPVDSRVAVVLGGDEVYAPQAIQTIVAMKRAFANRSDEPAIYFVHPRQMDTCVMHLVREAGATMVEARDLSVDVPETEMRMLKLETVTNPVFRKYSCLRWFDADLFVDPAQLRTQVADGMTTSCENTREFKSNAVLLVRSQLDISPVIGSAMSQQQIQSFEASYKGYPLVRSSTFVLFPRKLDSPRKMQSKLRELFKEFPPAVFSHGGQGALPFLFKKSQIALPSPRVMDFPVIHSANGYAVVVNHPRRQSCNPAKSDLEVFLHMMQANVNVTGRVMERSSRLTPTASPKCLRNLVRFRRCHEAAITRLRGCFHDRMEGVTASKQYQLGAMCLRMWQHGRRVLKTDEIEGILEQRTSQWKDVKNQYGWYRFRAPEELD